MERQDVAFSSFEASLPNQAAGRRVGELYAGNLLAAFLLGLVPMWLTARERAKELGAARTVLQTPPLMPARRYEPERQSGSEFFTNLREEIERGQRFF
ncbi:MAG: hypothetical protein WKF92_15625 [Pyrinomonadaceae bacterium]